MGPAAGVQIRKPKSPSLTLHLASEMWPRCTAGYSAEDTGALPAIDHSTKRLCREGE